MFSTFNFVDYVIIFSGVLFSLKRVAEMEKYHTLRVVVLTMLLSFFVILFFLSYGFTQPYWEIPYQEDCGCTHFCLSEM